VSHTRAMSLFTIAALLSCLALAVWGCSSPTDDDEDDDLYPLRSSPDSLIAKFARAYENMDVEAYLDCLADSMLFHLCEEDVENHPELEPGYWAKAVEDSIHRRMFGGGSPWAVNSISLSLATTEIETLRAAGDPARTAGWRYEEDADLRVWVGEDWTFWAQNPSSFVISVDPDDTGPHGETLYEIGEWRELDEWGAAERREHASWGSIKALYLVRARTAPTIPASH